MSDQTPTPEAVSAPPPRKRGRPRLIQLKEGDKSSTNARPEVQDLLPLPGERYEFRDAPLPERIPERILALAKFSRGAAREEVMRWMAPFIMKGATAAQIAQTFGISIHTVPVWRKQYREMLRKDVVTKPAIDHYAEAVSRIETLRNYLFNQLMVSAQQNAEGGNGQQQGSHRNLVGKVAVVRALTDLEKMQLLLNTGYGIAKTEIFERASEENTEEGKSSDKQLLNAVKDLMGEAEKLKNLDTSELLALFSDTPEARDLSDEDEEEEKKAP